MKFLITLTCMLVYTCIGYAQAPHVFDYSNAPKNPVGTEKTYGTVPSSVPVIQDAQHHTWDLSGVVLGSYNYTSTFSNLSGFPNAKAKYAQEAYLHVTPGVRYETNIAFGIDTSGIKLYGERLSRQAFSLAASTGNTADSIIIKAQDVQYSAPQVQMPYPATIGTKWNATSKSSVDLTLKVPAPPSPIPPFNNTPAQRKTTTISTNEVVGWGTMIIKRLDGRPAGNRDVLLVKTTLSIQDSMYINGAPAPQALLTVLGITQGETRVVYQKNFFRAYEMMPLANVTYTDATFSTIEDLSFHQTRLPYPNSVNDVEVVAATIYPNPSNGDFIVKVGDANSDDNWSYTVTDITGRVAFKGTLSFQGDQAKVSLANELVAGNYVVTVLHNDIAYAGTKLVIQ